jgi:hypothetical protein
MTYISGQDRSQILLLPEVVDDYVGPDNPVRFIDVFVDGLDLAAASVTQQPDHLDIAVGFGLQPTARSHPVQVAVYIYIYTASANPRAHSLDGLSPSAH